MPNKVSPRLRVVDRYLTAWIFAAMGLGVMLGWRVPGIVPFLNKFVEVPVTIALINTAFYFRAPLFRNRRRRGTAVAGITLPAIY